MDSEPPSFAGIRRRGRPVDAIVLGESERALLEALVKARSTPKRVALRARVVLALAEGLAQVEVAARLEVSEQLVGRWRARFAESGVDALRGKAPSGRRRRDAMQKLNAVQPTGLSTRELARRADLSQATVTRLLQLRALDARPGLEPVGLFVFGRDCVLALRDGPRGELGASGAAAVVADLRAHAFAAARLTVKRRSGLRLRRFLKLVERRFGGTGIVLVVAHADPPAPSVRRWLAKHPGVQLHVLGSAERWWSLVEARFGFAEALESLERFARERLDEGPQPKPMSWIA